MTALNTIDEGDSVTFPKGRTPVTYLGITARGRAAFLQYQQNLLELLAQYLLKYDDGGHLLREGGLPSSYWVG